MLSNNLNEFLFPQNSPIAQNQGQVSSFRFDYENESGVISTSKVRFAAIDTAQIADAAIGNAQIGTAAVGSANIATAVIGSVHIHDFSFNQGTGGTLTLGGTSNGNGLFSLKNAAGTEIVAMDNTGITVNQGSITVKDSAGTTIMDATGLVSTANFQNNFVTDTGTQETTSSSYTDVNGMSLSIVLTRAANVLCWTNIAAKNWNSKAGAFTVVSLDLNGTTIGHEMYCPGIPGNIGGPDEFVTASSASSEVIYNMAAGTNTLKTRFYRAVSGTAAIGPGIRSLGYIVLGK